ncbi:hypothetical protein C1J03_18605 [Sulfitobacter sp. SK012]|uniref:hypothetical protein n=1 Tax=Sulfitobacter sp. SK012 TaxID=1389005 RepID=UPI000E0BF757|nr:hypothetical protein [Sulfitobacter sp. SK012]AXI47842.1 hypothetical protein C1J03_18605 [Sulfitobacter sp. SK012]
MLIGRVGIALRAFSCAAALALSGCGSAAEDSKADRTAIADRLADPADYAGNVTFRIAEAFPIGDSSVPFALYLGLAPETETRLRVNALIDLRELQRALPGLISDTLNPSCGLSLDVTLNDARAAGDTVRGSGTVKAVVYRCKISGTGEEERGARLLTQTVDVDVAVGVGIQGDCIVFSLVDLELAPRGVIGWLANLLGVTERVRTVIRETGRATLSENPVCPDLPEALTLLDLHYSQVDLREIGSGGIGAILSGSVDTGAETLISLLALGQTNGVLPNAGLAPILPTATTAGRRVDFRIDETLAAPNGQVAYGLDLRLATVAPTRIGVKTVLDLRDLQHQLPDLFSDIVLLDTCGSRITLQRLEAEAREKAVIARGRLDVRGFACERTGPSSWERGEPQTSEEVDVRAEMSIRLVEGCAVFSLLDLSRDPPLPFGQVETGSGRIQAARALLLDAVGFMLEGAPLCPEVPPELTMLDPQFERGEPQELDQGGIGVAVEGSIDVSTRTILEFLQLLQHRGALPPRP